MYSPKYASIKKVVRGPEPTEAEKSLVIGPVHRTGDLKLALDFPVLTYQNFTRRGAACNRSYVPLTFIGEKKRYYSSLFFCRLTELDLQIEFKGCSIPKVTLSVSRHLRKAKIMIQNTAIGISRKRNSHE